MNKQDHFESILVKIFIALLPLFLLEGYICKYTSQNFCKNYFFKNFWEENGLIENFQSILLVLSIFLLFKSFRKIQNITLIKVFLFTKIIALSYYFLEEISYGQHFFNWESTSFFLEMNNQKETNLHNISNLFDQLPRTLVMIWCMLCPLIFWLLTKFTNIRLVVIYPSKLLSYISITLSLLVIPDLLIDKLDLHPGHVDQFGKDILEAKFYDIITFNFIRLSELHELIFTFYFFIYSYTLNKISFVNKKIYQN
jgi:hypothetical protein